MKNLRLYILDGNATASGSITHAGSEVPYTVESVSSSKLKIYDIDLSKYTDITSVTANTQGSYMALVLKEQILRPLLIILTVRCMPDLTRAEM